jgi:hypothetical protein
MDGAHRALAQALRMQREAEERLWALERSIEGGVPLAQARDERAAMQWGGAPKPPSKASGDQKPDKPSPQLVALRQHRDSLNKMIASAGVSAETKDKASATLAKIDASIARLENEPVKTAVKPAPANRQGSDPPADNPHNALTPEERKAAGEGVGGTAERNSAPDTAFLDERSRKFPWQAPDKDGDWKPDRDLLIAAEKRAAAEGKPNIEARAKRLLAEHFPDTPKPAPKQSPSEAPRKRRWI